MLKYGGFELDEVEPIIYDMMGMRKKGVVDPNAIIDIEAFAEKVFKKKK